RRLPEGGSHAQQLRRAAASWDQAGNRRSEPRPSARRQVWQMSGRDALVPPEQRRDFAAEAADLVGIAEAQQHGRAMAVQADGRRELDHRVVAYPPGDHGREVVGSFAEAELVGAAQTSIQLGAGEEVLAAKTALLG